MTRKTALAAGAAVGAAALMAAGLAARPRKPATGRQISDHVPREYQPQRDSYLDELINGARPEVRV